MRPSRSCLPELRSPAAFADHPPSVCTSGEMVAAGYAPRCGGRTSAWEITSSRRATGMMSMPPLIASEISVRSLALFRTLAMKPRVALQRTERSNIDPPVEVLEIPPEVRLVVLPCHPVDTGGGFAFERVERLPERVDVDMVESIA